MDFIEELPASSSYNSILVVVDRFVKNGAFHTYGHYGDFIRLAILMVKHIFTKHGIPDSIISDRGAKFVSKFWRRVCSSMGIDRKLSTAYHPHRWQGDLQTFAGSMSQMYSCDSPADAVFAGASPCPRCLKQMDKLNASILCWSSTFVFMLIISKTIGQNGSLSQNPPTIMATTPLPVPRPFSRITDSIPHSKSAMALATRVPANTKRTPRENQKRASKVR